MSTGASPASVRKSAAGSASNHGSAKSRSKTPQSQTGPKTRAKSKSPGRRSKSPPKSAASKASSNMDQGESTTNKAGSATMRRVTLKSADITQRGLKVVDMCGQGMTVVPSTLFQRKDVGILDMSSNNLRSLPSDMKKLQTLVHLDISRNGIRCSHTQDFGGLPAELGLLQSLEVILISECNLPFIPPAIWKCKKLKVLDISRNKINILPPDVGNLEALQHLNAQQTNISTLPPEIAYCQAMEDILLWGNVIESLPDTMKEMPKLKNLAINNRSFTQIVDNYMDNLLRKGQIQSEHIPPVLFEIPTLDILDLEETKINSLPDKCVCQLNELYLAKNYFQKVPPVVLQLSNLAFIDLSENLITEIPQDIGKLTSLLTLRMNNNFFIAIPPSIGQLQNLEELTMGGNRLKALPNSIGMLKNLKTLILDRNELRSLPDTMVEMEQLETLDLTRNEITALPTNFYQMRSLKTAHTYDKFHKSGLWLHLNPLKVPPEEVWKTDNPIQIYKYLKKLQIMKTENLQRQKLIMLGESQCGKTSLLHTLVNGKSSMTEGIGDCTALIDYIAWKTENLVDFLIHDLGGDDVYKTTHPLFLDPKAFYLLVYDHRKYQPEKHYNAIGYWLELLYLYAPGAVVKIVGTQCDQCYPDFVEKTKQHVQEMLEAQIKTFEDKIASEIDNISKLLSKPEEAGLRDGQINNLKKQKFRLMMQKRAPLRIQGDIHLVSSAEGIQGIHDLVTELEVIAVNKDLFGAAQKFIPQNWIDFRMGLKMQNKENFLTVATTRNIARKYDIIKDTFDECLHFLKDIGDILWFENIPSLKDIIFQRPRALVHILKGLVSHKLENTLNFTDNRIFASKGQFTEETFATASSQLLQCGEISRSMLLCLWFYLQIDTTSLEQLLTLISHLDLAYIIPQPEVPLRKTDFYPLLVIPYYNQDVPPNTEEIWPPLNAEASSSGQQGEEVTPSTMEVELSLTFPLLYPNGLFERLSCRLQEQLSRRTDWRDTILTEFFSGKMLVTRSLHADTYDCVIRIRIRGEDTNFIKNTMTFVYRELNSLLSLCPGLIWYRNYSMHNCNKLKLEDCFPREVLAAD